MNTDFNTARPAAYEAEALAGDIENEAMWIAEVCKWQLETLRWGGEWLLTKPSTVVPEKDVEKRVWLMHAASYRP